MHGKRLSVNTAMYTCCTDNIPACIQCCRMFTHYRHIKWTYLHHVRTYVGIWQYAMVDTCTDWETILDQYLTLNTMVTDSEPILNGNTLIMKKCDVRVTKHNNYLIGVCSAASWIYGYDSHGKVRKSILRLELTSESHRSSNLEVWWT